MKTLWLLSLALTFAFYGCKDNSAEPKIDYEIAINGTFQVRLISNPSTGYSWHWVNRDAIAVVDTFNVTFLPDSPRDGSPGKEIWNFRGRMNGTGTLRMTYNRPWDPTTVLETKSITVKVR